MCGLAGFMGTGSSAQLMCMGQAIARRGPDDQGFFEAPGIGFVFRRLSIMDLSSDGHQPMSNEDGTIQVMLNGEIYGFQALREELAQKGYRFRSRSDTEVIIHGYKEWGNEVFSKLNGMFAIAIWDSRQGQLLLARDRLGKKPLYWTVYEGTLWFASELKALIAAGVVMKDVDFGSLYAYLRSDFIPTPRTIFQNVSKLEPATFLVWSRGMVQSTISFWSCPKFDLPERTSVEIIAGLHDVVDVAVRDRLVSDVNLGIFLSGGLDSAVVAESASRQSPEPLHAYTIGFTDATYDERAPAREIAKSFNLTLHEEVLSKGQMLSAIDEMQALLDEPLADAAILPQLLVSKFARNDLTVALSGDGGDELLLGYQHIRAHLLMQSMSHISVSIRTCIARVLRHIPARTGYFSAGFAAQRFARGFDQDRWLMRDLAWRGSCERETARAILSQDARVEFDRAESLDVSEMSLQRLCAQVENARDMWDEWTWLYLRSYLMDGVLVKVDRAMMWHGLEGRAPLLDTRVVTYLMQVPSRMKLGSWRGKRLFQELLRDRLPEKILKRPKHGFGVPVADWLRTDLKTELLRRVDVLQSTGWIDGTTVSRLIDEHVSGRIDRRKELWALFALAGWWEVWGKSS